MFGIYFKVRVLGSQWGLGLGLGGSFKGIYKGYYDHEGSGFRGLGKVWGSRFGVSKPRVHSDMEFETTCEKVEHR